MWFDGPITDAVAKTKADKTLLIVFVYGNEFFYHFFSTLHLTKLA